MEYRICALQQLQRHNFAIDTYGHVMVSTLKKSCHNYRSVRLDTLTLALIFAASFKPIMSSLGALTHPSPPLTCRNSSSLSTKNLTNAGTVVHWDPPLDS